MEPLPLEDAPPLQPRQRLRPKLLFIFVCIVLAFATFLGMRYRAGAVPEFAYAETTAEVSCKLLMIGHPAAFGNENFRALTSSHWSTPIGTELRLYEMDRDPDMVRPEDLFAESIQTRAKQLDAKVETEATVKWNEYQGREAVFVNGRTRWVERYLFVTKPGKPRLYVIAIGGSGLEANSEVVQKVFGSFRLK